MSGTEGGAGYYGNANPDILAALEPTAKRLCEVGCGTGGLARAYKRLNPACTYVGVELSPVAAARAREVADHVLVHDMDAVPDWTQDPQMHAMLPPDAFDYMIFGDVLEHLRDPAAVLRQAVQRLKPGGHLVACMPNVQHWSVFVQLLRGQWPQKDTGLFDRTHIRWFTRDDMVGLLKGCGLRVESVKPRYVAMSEEAKRLRQQVVALLEPVARVAGNTDVEEFARRTAALQFVLVARRD
jgi:SAM-dependent methyltransferase